MSNQNCVCLFYNIHNFFHVFVPLLFTCLRLFSLVYYMVEENEQRRIWSMRTKRTDYWARHTIQYIIDRNSWFRFGFVWWSFSNFPLCAGNKVIMYYNGVFCAPNSRITTKAKELHVYRWLRPLNGLCSIFCVWK